ncbi:MAG: hypothetical protein ABJC10_08905 [Acidobacteriota bacterium]
MPNKILATFVLLMSATFAYGIQADAEWVKFTSPKGLFSLVAPHELKPESENESTHDTVPHTRFNDFEGGYGFVFEYFENIPASDPEEYLDVTRDGIVKAIKGTVVGENKLNLDGHAGREITMSITTDNGAVVFSRTRFYLVGTNMFSLSYVWRKDMDTELAAKTGEKFFSSLKIRPE